MRGQFRLTLLLLCLLPLQALAANMTEINFQDQDPGAPAYPTRVLVTDAFMRIDNGTDSGDFLLLDRRKNRVYEVTQERREILVIDAEQPRLAKPERWQVREDVVSSPDSRTQHVNVYANDVLCTQVTVVPKLLPDAALALGAYRQALAGMQALTYLASPADLRSDCDLAQHVWEIAREFKHGFPIEQKYHDGRSRRMVDYHEKSYQPGLFVLPSGYRTVNIKELRAAPTK
jgi:hypothetical protein